VTRQQLVRLARPLAALAAAAVLTVGLTQSTTTAAFTAQTGDTGNQVSSATTFCTTPGTDYATMGEDTATNGTAGQTGVPNGSATTMPLGISPTAAGYGLIRFDLPNPRVGCTITAASLRLNASTAMAATMDVFRAGSAWTANTATWDNQPLPAGTPVSVTVTATAGEQAFPVRDLVRVMFSGPNYGFLVKDQLNVSGTTRYQIYDSFDHLTVSRRPQLDITWG
jgi:hypothetical protein